MKILKNFVHYPERYFALEVGF